MIDFICQFLPLFPFSSEAGVTEVLWNSSAPDKKG